jgi:hypothetical protein
MKHMNLITAVTLGIAALAFTTTGCDDTTETGGAGGATSSTGSKTTTTTTGSMTTTGSNMTSSSTGGNPPPPALGAQIDRFGRPAINTALNHPFDGNKTTKDAAKDTWNGNGTLSNWVSTFSAEVQGNLAVLDALDANCGNQLGAGATPVAGRYKTIGDVLSMDRLWINTAATTSTIYLAVEANALGAVPNTDGGGRTLPMDVIDTSYTLLGAGLGGIMIGDGISADADTAGTTFPFLAAPHM